MYLSVYAFLLILFLLILGSIAWAFLSLAPWVPARRRDFARILRLAGLKPTETFYELGSGDGRLTAYINKQSGARAIGIELAMPWFFFSKLRQWMRVGKNLEFHWNNLFYEDLSPADVVYVFGFSKKQGNKLRQKLEHELRSGSRVISYSFKISGWQPVAVDKPAENELPIYVYKI